MGVFWPIVWTCVALVVGWLYKNRARYREGIPYPPTTFWFGNYFDLNKQRHRSPDYVLECARKYGRTYGTSLPGRPPLIRIVDPKCAEHILKTRFDIYVKSIDPPSDSFFAELFGSGIFAVDGEAWMTQRKVASHMFTGRVLRDHIEATFVEHGKTLIARLDAACSDYKDPDAIAADAPTIDLSQTFFQFTMDSIATIAFGLDLKAQTSDESQRFTRAFDRIQEIMIGRAYRPKPIMLLMRKYKIGKLENEIAELSTFIHKYVGNIVNARRADIDSVVERAKNAAAGTANDDDTEKTTKGGNAFHGKFKGDLLSSFLIDAIEKKQPPPTDAYLRDVLLAFLIAGRDTTAALLSWTMVEIAANPRAFARMRAEIDVVLAGQPLENGERLKELPYTHAFLTETLRLHPSVPSDSKVAAADDTLPDGTPVKRGDIVLYPIYAFGRLESIWGPDAGQFRPERFLNLEKEESQYKYLMFNGGPRLCLGKRMAYTEAMMVCVLLIQRYEWAIKKNHPITYKPSIILVLKHGLPVHMRKRTAPLATSLDTSDPDAAGANVMLNSVFA